MGRNRSRSRTKARRFKRKPWQSREPLAPKKAIELNMPPAEPLFTEDGQRILRVHVEPGIGDFSWVYSKLACLNMPLHIVIPDGKLKRNSPLMEMLPNVVSHEHQEAEYKYRRFTQCLTGCLAQSNMTMDEFHEFVVEKDYNIWMSLNHWLEKGKRLDEFFPGCKTDYHYQIDIPQAAKDKARELTGDDPYLLIYPSSYKNNLGWTGWKQEDWKEFIDMFRDTFGHTKVVITGAKYDDDYESNFDIEDSVNLIGQTSLDITLAIIQNASYFVAFPSGLPIMANVLRTPCWMFYPRHLEPMQWAWADPEDIESKRYMASQWCEPSEVIRWLKEEYDLSVL